MTHLQTMTSQSQAQKVPFPQGVTRPVARSGFGGGGFSGESGLFRALSRRKWEFLLHIFGKSGPF